MYYWQKHSKHLFADVQSCSFFIFSPYFYGSSQKLTFKPTCRSQISSYTGSKMTDTIHALHCISLICLHLHLKLRVITTRILVTAHFALCCPWEWFYWLNFNSPNSNNIFYWLSHLWWACLIPRLYWPKTRHNLQRTCRVYPLSTVDINAPGTEVRHCRDKGQARTRHKHGVNVVLDRLARTRHNLRRTCRVYPCPLSI